MSPGRGALGLQDYCIEVLLDVPHWTIPRGFFDSLPAEVANSFLAKLLETYPLLPSHILEKFSESACVLRVPERQSSNLQLQYIAAAAAQFRRLAEFRAANQTQEAAKLLSLHANRISDSLRVLELPGLRIKLSRAAGMAGFLGSLTNLEHLDLHGSALPAAWVKDIAVLRRLTHLNLSHTIFHGRPGLEQLGSLHNLRHLNLDRVDAQGPVPGSQRILEKEYLKALLALTLLTYLNLSRTHAEFLPSIATLQSLHMRHCSLRITEPAPNVESLTELDLQSCRLQGAESEALLAEVLAAAKSRLKRLCLGGVVVDPLHASRHPDDIASKSLRFDILATVLMEAPQLQLLDLSDSVVATEEEVQPLMASLATLAALQTLRLGGSNLAFLGPDRCCELPASLTWLDLSAVRGEPEEPSRPDFLARALGKDGSLWTSRLKPIDGRSNWDSEATLLAALHLPNLTDLTMGRCGIGSWALVGLESKYASPGVSTSLRRLNLLRNSISLEVLQRILAAAAGLTELSICHEVPQLVWQPGSHSDFSLEPMEQEAAYVATIAKLRDLRRLCIGNVKYVSSLKPLSELQHLEELVILCSHLEAASKVGDYLRAAVKTASWPSLRMWHIRDASGEGESHLARQSKARPTAFCVSPRQAPEFADSDATLRMARQELLKLRPVTQQTRLGATLPAEILDSHSSG